MGRMSRMRPGRHIFLFISRMGLMGRIGRMRPGRHIFLFIGRMGLISRMSRMRPGRLRHSVLPPFGRGGVGLPVFHNLFYYFVFSFFSEKKKMDGYDMPWICAKLLPGFLAFSVVNMRCVCCQQLSLTFSC